MLAGWINQWALTSTFFWTMAICDHLRRLVRCQTRNDAVEANKWEIWYHLIGWGLPTVISIVPASKHYYGRAGGWCWIRVLSDETVAEKVVFRILPYYAPLALSVTFNTCSGIQIVRQVWSRKFEESSSGSRNVGTTYQSRHLKVIRRVIAYPCIQIFVTAWGLANRCSEISGPPIFWLNVVQGILLPSQGFWNALVYGVNEGLVNELREVARVTRVTARQNTQLEHHLLPTSSACVSIPTPCSKATPTVIAPSPSL
mmetsp:Transcript_6538/g.16042  ORF Transcript_6538/g.16042 Transcript_6538/m.16042 type:complete len:257 (-) Transcript_6538:45-815(-)